MIFLCFECPDAPPRFADFQPKDGTGEYAFDGMKKQRDALNTPSRYGRYYVGDRNKNEIGDTAYTPSYEEWFRGRVRELLGQFDDAYWEKAKVEYQKALDKRASTT